MRSISRHIMPLVINSLGGGHTHTHTQTHIQTIRTGSISRNQARAGLWPVRAWFKKEHNFICNYPAGDLATYNLSQYIHKFGQKQMYVHRVRMLQS